MRKIKEILAALLYYIGCKDVSLMLYGVKTCNFRLFFDGLFYGKYKYMGNVKGGLILELANNYKNYLGKINLKQDLISGLDEESIKTVNQIEKNIGIILDRDKPYVKKFDCGIVDDDIKVRKYIKNYKKDLYLPIDYHCTTSFFYKHGIYYIENLKGIIKGKDIIDCGSFIGDSALMFSKELGFLSDGGVIGAIYCLEPDLKNGELLKKTIINNNKEGKIIHIPLGVGKKKEKLYLDSSGATSVASDDSKSGYAISIDTIDNIVKDNKINPGLIKWDIEGLEYDSILGAKEVIKKYKPILLVSIYHNGRDFYTIKPLLESRNLGYKFKIRHLCNDLFFETMLICY